MEEESGAEGAATAVELPTRQWIDAVSQFLTALNDPGSDYGSVVATLGAEREAAQKSEHGELAEAALNVLDDVEQLRALIATANSTVPYVPEHGQRVGPGAAALLALPLRWNHLVWNSSRLADLCAAADNSWDASRLRDANSALSRATVEYMSVTNLTERYSQRRAVVTAPPEEELVAELGVPVEIAVREGPGLAPTVVQYRDNDPALVLDPLELIVKSLDGASPRPATAAAAKHTKRFTINVSQLLAAARRSNSKNDGENAAAPADAISRAREALEEAREAIRCLESSVELSVDECESVRHHLSGLKTFQSEPVVDAVRSRLAKAPADRGLAGRQRMPTDAQNRVASQLEAEFDRLREGAMTLHATIPRRPPD